MPYKAATHTRQVDREALRARIPGWGVDSDPRSRPSVPKEQDLPTGAHWDIPEPQSQDRGRERSIEHGMLPPVFGTAAPLKGLSGVLRRVAYARFSEGRAAHWIILLASDRVDVVESGLASVRRAIRRSPTKRTAPGDLAAPRTDDLGPSANLS